MGNRNASRDGGVFVSGAQFHEGRICLRLWNWLAVFPQAVHHEARHIDDGCLACERESSHRLQATENISDLHLCTIVSNETIVNLRELLEPA